MRYVFSHDGHGKVSAGRSIDVSLRPIQFLEEGSGKDFLSQFSEAGRGIGLNIQARCERRNATNSRILFIWN